MQVKRKVRMLEKIVALWTLLLILWGLFKEAKIPECEEGLLCRVAKIIMSLWIILLTIGMFSVVLYLFELSIKVVLK